MTSGLFGPQGANAATSLPPKTTMNRYGVGVQTWCKDGSAAGANDGTVYDAAFFNRIIGSLEYVITASEINATIGDMSALYRALTKISPRAGLVQAGDGLAGGGSVAGASAELRVDYNRLDQRYIKLSAGGSQFATLDGNGTLTDEQVPVRLNGNVRNMGQWDANTNTPGIPYGAFTKGYYYEVAVAGTTLIDGISQWDVGDWIVSNGVTWKRLKNGAGVNSFAGLQGDVTAANAKIALSIGYGDVSGLGTAARYDVGAGANQIVQRDAAGKLTGDGSLLTGIGSSGVTLLATLTASDSASLQDTTHLTSAYDLYMIVFDHIVPVTDGDYPVLQFTKDAGATWLTSGYLAGAAVQLVGTTTQSTTQRFTLTTGIPITASSGTGYGVGNTAGKGLSGTAYIDRPSSTSVNKRVHGTVGYAYTGGPPVIGHFTGYFNSDQAAINGFRLIMGASNIAIGVVRLYGIKTS